MCGARRVVALLAVGLCAGGQAAAEPRAKAASAPARLAEAKRALDHKDYGAAEAVARRIVEDEADPDEAVEAQWVLIQALAAQGRLLRAFQQCEKLLADHPRTTFYSDVLKREYEIGVALSRARGRFLVFTYRRVEDGVGVLEKVIEHAGFGELGDRAIYAIAEARLRQRDFEAARDQYDDLIQRLERVGRRGELYARARIGRAACNYHLTEGAAYDLKPARDAVADLAAFAPTSGQAAQRRDALRNELALNQYKTALFYFRRHNVRGALRYLESLLANYPDTPPAARARRILKEVILAKFPDTEHAARARRALGLLPPRDTHDKERP